MIISKPKGTWRILFHTAGPSRHNHGKMHPWKSLASSLQDVPQVSKINFFASRKYLLRWKPLSQVQNPGQISQWCPCTTLDRLQKTPPGLQSGSSPGNSWFSPCPWTSAFSTPAKPKQFDCKATKKGDVCPFNQNPFSAPWLCARGVERGHSQEALLEVSLDFYPTDKRLNILCGVPEKSWSSWISAKQRKTRALQGSHPRPFFPKQNKNIFWKHRRLLQREIKVSNSGLVGAKPVSSSSGWGARVRREKCLALEEKSLRQRRNQMRNIFLNSKRKFQTPLHDSCLQCCLPEIIQNDSSGPCCSSPPLEFPMLLEHPWSWRPPAPTLLQNQNNPAQIPLSGSSIRRKTGHSCFQYLFSALKEQEIWAICFIHCIFCYSSILENSL